MTFCHRVSHAEGGVIRCLEASAVLLMTMAKGAVVLGKAVLAWPFGTARGAEKDGRVVHFSIVSVLSVAIAASYL